MGFLKKLLRRAKHERSTLEEEVGIKTYTFHQNKNVLMKLPVNVFGKILEFNDTKKTIDYDPLIMYEESRGRFFRKELAPQLIYLTSENHEGTLSFEMDEDENSLRIQMAKKITANMLRTDMLKKIAESPDSEKKWHDFLYPILLLLSPLLMLIILKMTGVF